MTDTLLYTVCWQSDVQKVFINSMTVKSPFNMYKTIAMELLGSKAAAIKNTRDACSQLCKSLCAPGMYVCVCVLL